MAKPQQTTNRVREQRFKTVPEEHLSEVPAVFQNPASLVTYLKDNALSFTLTCFS